MPFSSEPNRTGTDRCDGHCPVCDQTGLTVVAELSTSLFFRCETCGFIWIEDKPETLDTPKGHLDD